jgi:hypothetical protein
MKYIANFSIGRITRESAKPYTHAIFCASFTHDGVTHCSEVSFATSEKEALRRADGMGYSRKFKHWSAGRRVYTRSKTRAAIPEIVAVTVE